MWTVAVGLNDQATSGHMETARVDERPVEAAGFNARAVAAGIDAWFNSTGFEQTPDTTRLDNSSHLEPYNWL